MSTMPTHTDSNLDIPLISIEGDIDATTDATNSTTNADAAPTLKRLTDLEKGKIIFAYEQEWGYQRIGDYLDRPKTTIQSFIKRYIEWGAHENGKHTGCPKKISEDVGKVILDLIEGDCSISKMALMQIPELAIFIHEP